MELSNLLDIICAFSLGMWFMEKVIHHRIRKSLKEAGVDFTEEKPVEVIKVEKYFIENTKKRTSQFAEDHQIINS